MKTVLITGCSSGFGRATALHFHEQGWNVVATMRAPDRHRASLPASDRFRVLALDVTSRTSIDAAVREGIEAFGGLDVAVNNAGIGLFGALEATPERTAREVFETNVFGVMAVAQAVVPHFRERRAGTLVNVTSSAGIVPMPLVSVYTASKFAIEGFTEALSYELSYFGAGAKIVEPGYAPGTSFTASGMERMRGLVPPSYAPYAEQLLGGLGGGKHTVDLDVARAVWLAATDGSTRLRYPAGPDAEDLAALRRAFPGEDYLERMRAAVGPRAAATPSRDSSHGHDDRARS
jgi:NAD(P)-dependent dehydrogenase (short-subunit alcohol dehydrogenase family)